MTMAVVHPLDAFPLDGFVVVATAQSVVRRDHAEVWRLLAESSDESLLLPAGAVHRVVETFGPGEHRCSVVQTTGGRQVCVRGFRRLLAHREVLEVYSGPAEDRLLRVTYAPLRFGRTRMTTDAAVRLRPERTVLVPVPAVDTTSWSELLHERHLLAAALLA